MYLVVDMRERHGVGDGEAALVLFLKNNIRRLLVDSNPESLELGLDDLLISQWLIDIENDEDQVTGLCNGDHLTSSTLAIFGSLNDTRQIEHLNGGAVVLNLAWHSRQCGKLIGSNYSGQQQVPFDSEAATFGMLSRQLGHQGGLPHRRKTDEANAGDPSTSNIKSSYQS